MNCTHTSVDCTHTTAAWGGRGRVDFFQLGGKGSEKFAYLSSTQAAPGAAHPIPHPLPFNCLYNLSSVRCLTAFLTLPTISSTQPATFTLLTTCLSL